MTAFMHYIQRIDLLATMAAYNYTDFIDYAVDELRRDIAAAVSEEYLTPYQLSKLYERLERII